MGPIATLLQPLTVYYPRQMYSFPSDSILDTKVVFLLICFWSNLISTNPPFIKNVTALLPDTALYNAESKLVAYAKYLTGTEAFKTI